MKGFVLIDGRPAQGRPRGVGIYALRLVEALAKIEKSVTIKLALDRRAGEDPWPGKNGLERVWGSSGNPARWEQMVLPKLAKRSGASLVHYTANNSAWRGKVPQVVTIHDAIFMRKLRDVSGSIYPRQFLAHHYYRYGIRRGARRANRIFTDSEYSQTELINKLGLPIEKIRVIPLAGPYKTAPLSEIDLQDTLQELNIKRPYLLGLGAIDMRKNSANLVRAFARLPRSALQMLVLAGFEKYHRSTVPALSYNLNIQDRLRILGYIPEKLMTALFQGAAAFAYPTRVEGFGLPILQAFHLGVPVITSRVGAIPEVAANAVRYADPEDPCSISEEILSVIVDPNEAHRMALAGYLQAKRFSWKTTAQKTLHNYLQVLGIRA